MGAVHVWKCRCGKRVRVITEQSESEHSIAACPGCQHEVTVEGAIVALAVETGGIWQTFKNSKTKPIIQ
jgi:hypothetical protein